MQIRCLQPPRLAASLAKALDRGGRIDSSKVATDLGEPGGVTRLTLTASRSHSRCEITGWRQRQAEVGDQLRRILKIVE